ncbi:MAG: hypothetical protein GWN00_01200 [Aliifodinibius sp.]|nr:hypothetical protein [Fodinibius sp.]NIV09948.1 hypothetical protein [Fodinibius sp.]NIY23478.1 hypothetical protein [Fodinibius sp.]
MKILGIAGLAGSGKTTLAGYFTQYGWVRDRFAEDLKTSVSSLFDIPMESLEDPKAKLKVDPRYGKSPREIMQLFGTECIRRHFGAMFWVEKLHSRVTSREANTVIDDVRFMEEAAYIRKFGVLIHVVRHDVSTKDTHESERGITPMEGEVILQNNGPMINLWNFVQAFEPTL